MIGGPAVLLLPLAALVVTRGPRTVAGFAAAGLLAWLNLWWALPLFDLTLALPDALAWPQMPAVSAAGYLIVLLLLLIAVGVFSPAKGSPAEMALRASRRGDYLAAGEFWLEASRPRRAFRAFSRARAWSRAADVARSLGRLRQAAELLQREGGVGLGSAAQILARLGEEADAARLWQRYGLYLIESRQSEAAIEAFLRAGDSRRAASAVEMALEAGRLSPGSGDAAMRAAREAKRPQLAASVALLLGRFREAGDLFLAANQPVEAARAFERAGEPMRAVEALRLAGREDEASRLRGRRLAEAGQLEAAVEEYTRAGMVAEAAVALTQLGRVDEAIALYRGSGRLREAAELARDEGDAARAAVLFSELGDWNEAGTAWERAGDPTQAARCYEQGGDLLHAVELLAHTGLRVEHGRLLARVGRVEEALRELVAEGEIAAAAEVLSQNPGSFPALAPSLLRIAEWYKAQGDTGAAISTVQRATAGQPVGTELLPAFYTLGSLLEEVGDLRAAEATLQKIVEHDYSFRDAPARLQAIAARRAADEGQKSGAFRVPSGEPPAGERPSRYRLEQELGRGGMGVVYRAFDERLGRTVAVKVLNPHQHTPEALRRFEREARSAAALSHPGIVHIYDFDTGFGSSFIAMELVSGPTLAQLLREEAPFVARNLLPLMRQIVDAVAFAHSRQVVHRDLKPANMILADRKQMKILDFGIARRLDDLDNTASGATGTPYYMAPEQILGEVPDQRTDVYALGVTFFQMATGGLPFSTGNVLRAHLDQPPPDPASLAPGIEPAVSHLILRCLAKDRRDRYGDGAALAATLAAMGVEKSR